MIVGNKLLVRFSVWIVDNSRLSALDVSELQVHNHDTDLQFTPRASAVAAPQPLESLCRITAAASKLKLDVLDPVLIWVVIYCETQTGHIGNCFII